MMQGREFSRIRWLLASIFLIGLCIMMARLLERMIVYYPTSEITGTPADIGLEYRDLYLTAEDGVKLHSWHIPYPGARQTLLILHGNAGNIGHRVPWLELLHPLGVDILLLDYRGYGRSGGSPHEQGLYLDAAAAYRWWEAQRAPTDQLVLVGESLGGAVAVDLAARGLADGLVLQSTFTSAWDMAKTMMPIGLLQPLSGVSFNSAEKIPRVRCPMLFIHGDRDEIVPLRLGRKLYELAAGTKEFYQVAGAGHNDLLWIAATDYIDTLRHFLGRVASASR